MSQDARVAEILQSVTQIYAGALTGPSTQWPSYLPMARSVMAAVDATSFMAMPQRASQQAWVLEGLQKLAFKDHDHGAEADIASWCLQHWLAIVQRTPDNVDALQGLGHYWLLSAQPYLARIHARDRRSSSSRSSGRGSNGGGNGGAHAGLSPEEEPDDWPDDLFDDVNMDEDALTDAEADALLHGPDYVQARAILHPSLEYFRSAVAAADAQGRLTGELLALAAEANMSLGNVSYSQSNQGYFRQAILYLRQASSLEGYQLPPHLEQYLNEYGSYVD